MLIPADSTPDSKSAQVQSMRARQEQSLSRMQQTKHTRKQVLGTQPSHQLPLWEPHVDTCGAPNVIIRSALFNARNRAQLRRYFRNESIVVIGNGRITYTGEELRQDDETVWLQLIHLARYLQPGDAVEFTPYSFCKAICWPVSGNSYQRLRCCLRRLQATSMQIYSERLKEGISLSMLPVFEWRDGITNLVLKHYRVKIAPPLVKLFQENYTMLKWEQRLALPDGLATWLHGYYSTHSRPHPIKLETIKIGAGITAQPKHLLDIVKRALEALKGCGFLVGYRIEGDLVHVTRHTTRRGKFSMLNRPDEFSGGQRR